MMGSWILSAVQGCKQKIPVSKTFEERTALGLESVLADLAKQ